MRAVVLIVNGLQPTYLGAYGCDWVPTPTFDHWAATGVVFDGHFLDHFPPAEGTQGWSGDPAATELVRRLTSAGVRTAYVGPSARGGWGTNVVIERDPGPITLKPTRRAMRQAIEQLADAPTALLCIEIDALLPPWTVSDETFAELTADLSDDDGEEGERDDAQGGVEPWTEVIPEQVAHDDLTTVRRLQGTYAAAVADLDVALGRLWKDCSKVGWGSGVAWFVTGDSGFPLGEHGFVGLARAELHEELIHVPMLVRWPDEGDAGLRVGGLTQSHDAFAMIQAYFADASPLNRKRVVRQPQRSHLVISIDRDDRQWGIRTADWYLLGTDGPEIRRQLYVKPDDRWEFNDVAQHHQETVAKLEAMYRSAEPPD